MAIQVQTLSSFYLWLSALLLMLIAFQLHALHFFALVRRSRWILVSVLLVYLFSTPGEALWLIPYIPTPTREGLVDGVMQMGRLMCLLASLSILLTQLPREKLMSGIFSLIYPVRFVGVSRERIAVRLALTLHYAENAMRDTVVDWRAAMSGALSAEPSAVATELELNMQQIARLDVLCWLLCGVLLLGIWR